jgi:folate-binding protein YgfZ
MSAVDRLRSTAVALRGAWWSDVSTTVVEVTGADSLAYLDGQLSQAIGSLAVGEGAWSFLLEPDGHLGHLLAVGRVDEERTLLVPAPDRALDVVARLERFRLRSAVTVHSLEVVLRTSSSPRAMEGSMPTGVPGAVRGIAIGLGDGEQVSPERAALERLLRGQPSEVEGVVGLVPLGLGSEAVERAASFDKGCYTGQELVARTTSRQAPPPASVRRFVVDGEVQPDDACTIDGEVVGRVLSAAGVDGSTVGFALVARRALGESAERLEANEKHLLLEV